MILYLFRLHEYFLTFSLIHLTLENLNLERIIIWKFYNPNKYFGKRKIWFRKISMMVFRTAFPERIDKMVTPDSKSLLTR